MVLLEFQNVAYHPEHEPILTEISFEIAAGEFLSIVGPSGSGKSTLLKLCCLLISPTSGQLLYRNQELSAYEPTDLRKRVSYCAQTPYLFGTSVQENIAFPFTIRNLPVDHARVNELVGQFELDQALLTREVQNLSGGEKQRLALIRTLLFPPEVLLLDEITSALDLDNSLIVEKAIKALNQAGTTILWVTHNLEQSKKNAQRLLTLESGKIKALEDISRCMLKTP